jgi:fumarate hydratase subunit alpha
VIRKIPVEKIEKKVQELCYKANAIIRPDVLKALKEAFAREKSASSKRMIQILIENAEIAKKEKLPLCQDTGLAAVFIETGQDVHITGGVLAEAIDRGVEKAYTQYNFRKSVVTDPITRQYKGTNIPAVLHAEIVRGNKIKITVMPKGFGSENKGAISMLDPTSGEKEITDFCVRTVAAAGPDACPPYILGVGIGGTMDMCALLSKKALLRSIDPAKTRPRAKKLENRILKKVNQLGIGVMGLGGKTTALAVNVELAPTHIAGLPVAVALSCHSLRSASGEI